MMCQAFSLLLCLAGTSRTWARSLETKESKESTYETVVSEEGEDYCGSSEAPETNGYKNTDLSQIKPDETDMEETSIGESKEVERNQTNTSSGKVSIKKDKKVNGQFPLQTPSPL